MGKSLMRLPSYPPKRGPLEELYARGGVSHAHNIMVIVCTSSLWWGGAGFSKKHTCAMDRFASSQTILLKNCRTAVHSTSAAMTVRGQLCQGRLASASHYQGIEEARCRFSHIAENMCHLLLLDSTREPSRYHEHDRCYRPRVLRLPELNRCPYR